MILLIDRQCRFCKQLEDLDKQYKEIHKFYVENGIAKVNGEDCPLDPRISLLPCLIDGNHYYFTVEPILEHLKSIRSV